MVVVWCRQRNERLASQGTTLGQAGEQLTRQPPTQPASVTCLHPTLTPDRRPTPTSFTLSKPLQNTAICTGHTHTMGYYAIPYLAGSGVSLSVVIGLYLLLTGESP